MSLKGIGHILDSHVTDLLFVCMEPATDTELLHHTLDVDALVRIYARHLQDDSMLAKLNKEDVIVQEANNHIRCLVNVPLQP